MTPNIQEWVKKNRPEVADYILEIGSLNVNGGVRHLFNPKKYTGIDLVLGNGVDYVMSGHDVHEFFGSNNFDTVICLETIEHDEMFWITIQNISKVLQKDGYFILSSPTIDFPLHHEPDYYRFTERAITSLIQMAGCEVLRVESLPDTVGKHSIIGIGKKSL